MTEKTTLAFTLKASLTAWYLPACRIILRNGDAMSHRDHISTYAALR
jgi:hypothetical protein